MVQTKANILEGIKTLMGDDTSDTSLQLLSDISDTIDDYEKKITNAGSEDWKKKYEENDAQWRQKYKDRFFSTDEVKPEKSDPVIDDESPKLKTQFNQLFE